MPRDSDLAAKARTAWITYHRLEAWRLIGRDLDRLNLRRMLAAGPAPNAVGPYQFRPAALASVQERFRGAAPKAP
jgi:hypothetical protein